MPAPLCFKLARHRTQVHSDTGGCSWFDRLTMSGQRQLRYPLRPLVKGAHEDGKSMLDSRTHRRSYDFRGNDDFWQSPMKRVSKKLRRWGRA